MTTALKTKPLPFVHPDDMPDQYALIALGQCMVPLIEDKTLLVFDKRQQPHPGDMVGLVFTREAAQRWGLPGLVKKLALALPPTDLPRGFRALIVVDQINPPRRYAIPTEDILAVHKAIGIAENDGPGRAWFRPSSVEAWT